MAGAMESMDSLDTRQSKQRASIKWLLSKAFNNRVPENLQEPFYRDHEDQEHLKPPIVGGLANAELYCLALANMYSDPNYHSLNHWNILQTLARKAVQVHDPPDAPLTETVLIQTNPIRMSAHMCVMEALMTLYAREVVTPERVAAAVQRFGCAVQPAPTAGHEEGLVLWINAACAALNKAQESSETSVPAISSLQDVCDGTALATLISFYCPEALPRASVRVGRMTSLQDCLHNLMLVRGFCHASLPHDVFHMLPEDVTYMRGSMRPNLVAMLADLFNMLEVHPAKCVKYPATVPRSPSASVVNRTRAGHRSACSTPERRSASPARPTPAAAAPAPPVQDNEHEQFVVHRGKGVTTLSSMARQSDDRVGEGVAAGRPSNWEDSRGASYAGRRSRRSSISDDSQLTVENFGGSQDRLNFCGRNPEKQLATFTSARKISAPAGPVIEPAVPVRSLKQDIRGSLQFMYDELAQEANDTRKQTDRQTQLSNPHQAAITRQTSSDAITMKQRGGGDGFFLNRDAADGDISNKMSFADMRFRSNGDQSGGQSIYSGGSETEDTTPARKKSTSFTTPPPNTTTWQEQSMQHDQQHNGEGDMRGLEDGGGGAGVGMATQLNNIRLKLEEKRRRIEQEKRRMELSMNKQRQRVGQQAFLQAVTRGKAAGGGDEGGEVTASPARPDKATAHSDTDKPFTLQEISSEVANVESRWLKGNEIDNRNSPDVDSMAIEEYQQSIAKMNDSLYDIQSDIARLVSQQNQLQSQNLIEQQHQNQQIVPNQINQQSQYQSQHNQLQNQHNKFQNQNSNQLKNQHSNILQNQHSIQHINQLQNQHSNQQQQVYQQQYQPPAQPNIPHLHNQYSSQHNISSGPRHGPSLHNTNFGSTPHIPHAHQRQDYHFHPPEQTYNQYQPQENYNQGYQRQSQGYQQQSFDHDYQRQDNYEQGYGQSPRQFYLHETPPPVQRRTWAQQAQAQQENEHRGWQLHQTQHTSQQSHQLQQTHNEPQRTWKSPSPQPPQDNRWNPQSFVLADRSHQAFPVHYNNQDRYQNGDQQNHLSYTVISPSPAHHSASPPLMSSPQRRSKTPQRQGSLPDNIRRQESVSLQQLSHSPIPAPTVDDMEPQNISFIGNAEDDALQQGISRLNISSGTRTYRIPSPTRPFLNRNSFQQQQTQESSHSDASGDGGDANEKGFYISFDNDQPKRPKPPLRSKRGSPRKERTPTEYRSPERESPDEASPWQDRVPEPFVVHQNVNPVYNTREMREEMNHRQTPPRERLREGSAEPAAIVIVEKIDPNSAEEMEKKKERIMLLSLQRRERAEESRARAEQAAAARRARDERVAEERAAKKEEQARRRQAILAEYKLKKAIEEAEREGKVLDKSELMASLRPSGASAGPAASSSAAKLRHKAGAGARVRPKTIHVDSGALEAAGLARKQGSSTNLTAYGGSTMRRDYYRGSQDSLADRAGLYRDSPVEESGVMSPGAGSTGSSAALGRRGSYRTSRGPRLYKQPTTKSNRGIMLNAVEYCVFPGAVNKEAKRRVLEEIARSESKHFLVLFRDAGCQFRALYSYCPDSESITKLYGTGPRNVNDRMFDKFFKYNSGSKCFSQIHTKHLTVTIDAFTIHNSLWQGKKVNLPSKKDMALVI